MAEKKVKDVAATEAPKTNVEGAEAPKKEKVLIPDIIRGRMPIAVVYMVRFGDQKGGETRALADLFGTTVGKITDIKKRSTFAYLPENFKPTQTQKDEGIAWLQKHVGFKDGKVDVLINELDSMKAATTEEAAAYEALRIANRGQLATKKDGSTADAGGGNRQAAKKAAPAAAAAAAKPSAKDLI
jgi:hypothetical protein